MSFLNSKEQLDLSPLIRFYSGKGRTISSSSIKEGYTLHEIYNWSFDKLEDVHDYIQWLFPLQVRSAFNPQSPILTNQEIELFINNENLTANLIKSFKLMMKFYGFECDDLNNSVCVKKAVNHDERIEKWLTKGNHNYLRITRMLKSLKILGLSNYANAFLKALNELYQNHKEKISTSTHRFWVEAITDNNNG